jgi:oligopeptidase A
MNPLLRVSLPIPFDQIRPEHVRPALRQLIQEAQAAIDTIAAAPGPRSYANTMGALDVATEPLDIATGIVRHLEAVATNAELREAHNEMQPEIASFYAGIPLNAELWRALKAFQGTGEAKALDGVKARFLKKTVDSFRRHGADLDAAGKKRFSEIDVELSTTTTKFAQNVLDSTAQFEYWIEDETKLAGLPPSAVEMARAAAEAKGKPGWRFTLQAPSYLAVMTYLADGGVRELFYKAYNRRATEAERNNVPLVARILELRAEKAQLLGYANFADLVLEDRMAKRGAAAQSFLAGLEQRTHAPFERENAALEAYRSKVDGTAAPLAAWDIGYYAEKQRTAEYAFEEEDLRPYFPLQSVLAGMFELVRRLYGIEVKEAGAVPVWHPDVKFYEIRDEDGALLGSFYADWHPRETKRGGAWMDAFLTAGVYQGEWRPHVGLMCGNLTPPAGGKPALLSHRDVETIFHEFGHLLHHCLSKVEIRSLAGTSVAWDFVELPSQIMENWCWERESLDLFARHYQTGEPIPEELLQKMRRARTFRSANGQMRQLSFGTVDLALHTGYDAVRDGEPVAYSRTLMQRFVPAPLPADHAMIAAFTHLFADPVGYGAAYYSYKWAEVLEADAFSRFRNEGLFNRTTGLDFRSKILARGDGEDPAVLFRDFMGRDPDPAALFARLGIA